MVDNQVDGFLAHGGRLAFGSDTPSAPTYGNPPGLNGLLELEHLAGIGVPLDTLFAALTLEMTRAFGIDDTIGSVDVVKNSLETFPFIYSRPSA